MKAVEAREDVTERWQHVEVHSIPTNDVAPLNDDIRERLDVFLGDALSVMRADALADALSREIAARSKGPEEYVRFAAADRSTRFIGPDSEWWQPITQYLKVHNQVQANPNDPEGALRAFLDGQFHKKGARIVSVALDAPAFQVGVYRARSISEAYERSSLLDTAAYDESFWSGTPGSQGFRFREPIRTIDDVINEHGSVMMASTHMLVEDEAGRRWRWWVLWYWDDERWQILQTACGGWDAIMFF